MINFFSKHDEQRIIVAIQEAECDTSGEIRVHLERPLPEETDLLEAAVGTFQALHMHETLKRNGVLFFIVPDSHLFAVIGDEGINSVVPPHFWEDVRDVLQRHFKQGDFATGLCEGIKLIGQKLKEYFPSHIDDTNELPDEISYGR